MTRHKKAQHDFVSPRAQIPWDKPTPEFPFSSDVQSCFRTQFSRHLQGDIEHKRLNADMVLRVDTQRSTLVAEAARSFMSRIQASQGHVCGIKFSLPSAAKNAFGVSADRIDDGKCHFQTENLRVGMTELQFAGFRDTGGKKFEDVVHFLYYAKKDFHEAKLYSEADDVDNDPKTRAYVASLVQNAKMHKPSGFDLTCDQIIALLKEQHYLCHHSEKPLGKNDDDIHAVRMSIDRIDDEKPYTVKNVCLCRRPLNVPAGMTREKWQFMSEQHTAWFDNLNKIEG